MSARIVAESSSRVVDRPRRRADATSAAFASAIGAKTGIVGEERGKACEEVADLIVGAPGEPGEAIDRSRHRRLDEPVFGSRDVQEVAGVLDDDQLVTRCERSGKLGADVGDSVAAEHDRLAGLQAFERAHQSSPSSSGRSDIITGRPLSIDRWAAKPIAADLRPSIRVTAGSDPERIAAAKSTCSR